MTLRIQAEEVGFQPSDLDLPGSFPPYTILPAPKPPDPTPAPLVNATMVKPVFCICFPDPSSHARDMSESSWFSFLADNAPVECDLRLDEFAFPHDDQRGDVRIIAGSEDDIPRRMVSESVTVKTDEWKRLTADPSVRLVGGTIVIRGLPNMEERKAVNGALKAMVRCTWNRIHADEQLYSLTMMHLELAILDGFGVSRESQPITKTAPTPPKSEVRETEQSDRKVRNFFSNLFGRTRGMTESRARPTRSNTLQSLGLPAVTTGVDLQGKMSSSPDHLHSGPNAALGDHLTRLQTFTSFLASPSPNIHPSPPQPLLRLKTEMEQFETDMKRQNEQQALLGLASESAQIANGFRAGGDLMGVLDAVPRLTIPLWWNVQSVEVMRIWRVDDVLSTAQESFGPETPSVQEVLDRLSKDAGTMTWATDDRQVAVASQQLPQPDDVSGEKSDVQVWLSCNQCDASSALKTLDELAKCVRGETNAIYADPSETCRGACF